MSVPKRFGILRFISRFLKITAWIVLFLSIVGAIAIAAMPDMASTLSSESGLLSALGGGGLASGTLLIMGIIYFFIFYTSGENLHLRLATEENTRLGAALLLKMHQDDTEEAITPYGGGGGFANDPFEG